MDLAIPPSQCHLGSAGGFCFTQSFSTVLMSQAFARLVRLRFPTSKSDTAQRKTQCQNFCIPRREAQTIAKNPCCNCTSKK